MKKYDVFLSYRRNGAEDFARALFQDLKHKKFSVFLDRQCLMSGQYEKQVLDVIRNCRDVVIILPPNALDRCSEEDDLFRKEIACAIENNKNIISIMRDGFRFPAVNTLPEEIRTFPKYEAIMENPNAYDSVMKRLCDMLKDSKKKQNKIKTARLKRIIAVAFAAIIVISGSAAGYCVINDNDNPVGFYYQYPRETGAYYVKKSKDTGGLQNVYLHIDAEKFFDNIGLEIDINNSDAEVKKCMFMLDGDVKSFPFEGDTSVLGYDETVGEYQAEVVCYFYKSFCEDYTYVLGTDDKKSALKMMKKLYSKYNNGSGAVFDNAYIVYNVTELGGGTLYMSYGKNNTGKECFFFRVYDIIDTQKEEAEKPGNITVDGFEGKTFRTYDYKGNAVNESVIHSVDVERTKYSVKCIVTGEKTSDVNGDNNISAVKYALRLLNENNQVIETTSILSPDIKTGETFVKSVSFFMEDYDIKENFIIEIEEDVK